jgi:hypothetical protein
MTRIHTRLGAALLLAWGVLGGLSQARSQDDKDLKIHTLSIYNGPVLTVYYSGKGLTADERAAMEDYQRAQNDLAQALEQQATAGQPAQTTRRTVKNDWSYSVPFWDAWGWGYGGYGYWGMPPLGLGYGAQGYFGPYTSYPGYGGYYFEQSQSNVEVTTQTPSAAERLAAAQKSREAVDKARKELAAALDRVHKQDRLRAALGLEKRKARE